MKALTRRGFLSVDRLWATRRRASVRNQPSPSDVTLYDAGLHNRSRNRVRNWVRSRIWPSRDHFLSTPPTRKTTIVPLLRLKFLGTSCGCPARTKSLPRIAPFAVLTQRRRRHQPRRLTPAKIKPGRPAPGDGARNAYSRSVTARISPQSAGGDGSDEHVPL